MRAFKVVCRDKEFYVKAQDEKSAAKKVIKDLKSAQGYDVVELRENAVGRKFAILKRANDFVVAAGYDVSDGTWNQGYYDFATKEDALKFLKTKI